MLIMESSPKAAYRGAELTPDALEILQAATQVLASVAPRSLDVLDGAVTLPQFRILAVLADFGRARSAQIAQALGIQASTVTRFTGRMVAADLRPGTMSQVTVTRRPWNSAPPGQDLVGQVTTWREQELARICHQLPLAERADACPRAAPVRGGRRSAITCSRCAEVKSEPWSMWKAPGMPHTCQPGHGLRQIACRNASAVVSADGAPRLTAYPATAREWSSSIRGGHGRPGRFDGVITHRSSRVWSACQISFGLAASRRCTRSNTSLYRLDPSCARMAVAGSGSHG